MIIIAESTSTKTEWCLISRDEILESFITEDINPSFQTRKQISHIVRLQLPHIFFKAKAKAVYFYGVGCTSEDRNATVKASLEAQLKIPSVIASDLLGSARALFQEDPGIACVLGASSNSCFYDGKDIVENVKPLGIILGDEGSGAVLGKSLLSDCLKGLAPKHLRDEFYFRYKIEEESVLDSLYTDEAPNKILASFSNFLSDHLSNEYVVNLIRESFRLFFVRNLLQYNIEKYPMRFVGDVAYRYSTILKEVSREYDVQVNVIEESSIPGLIKYHQMRRAL